MLYAPSAQLLGAKPDVYEGTARVLEYFSELKPGGRVDFDQAASAITLTADVVAASFRVHFTRDGARRPMRMTWTLVRRDARWLIASHHASPVPAAP